MRLIVEDGALDEEGATVEVLAGRLGVGGRQLTRLFARHVKASPNRVAKTARVQRAKRLLDETDLPMTEIALRAGFRSLRRFNAVFAQVYRRPPTEVRRGGLAMGTRNTGVRLAWEGNTVTYRPINFGQKFKLFQEQWQPKVVAEMNDYQFKIVKLEGYFVWHHHKDTDETFIVLEGTLRIDFRDGAVNISDGEMFVVPKGVEHKPYAEREVKLLLIEPRGVPNTGDEGGERTAEQDVWI
jgi:mannose-6-phosphate isomerase-like protein (cupin superfamily)/AraC-like DNA-binding protein